MAFSLLTVCFQLTGRLVYKQKIPAQNIPCPAPRMTARWQSPGSSPDFELAHLAIKAGPGSHLEPVLRKVMDFARLVLPHVCFSVAT